MKFDQANPMIGVAKSIQKTFIDAPDATPKEFSHATVECSRWIMGIEEAVMKTSPDNINWKWVKQGIVALHEVIVRARHRAYMTSKTKSPPSIDEQLVEGRNYAIRQFNKLKKLKQ